MTQIEDAPIAGVNRTGVGHTGWVGRLLLGHTARQGWWVGSTGHYQASGFPPRPVDGVRLRPRLRRVDVCRFA
jgi:hypothetical protein